MKNKIKIISLLASLSLSLVGLASCGDTATKIHVEVVTDGPGTIVLQNMDEDGYVPLNEMCEVFAVPDEGYYLSSLHINKKDITDTLVFTPKESRSTYTLSGTFLENNGEYNITLDGPSGVEVGETGQLTSTVYGLNSNVSYFVSEPELASVDSNGVITGKKAGFVTVTATAEGSNYRDPVTASHVVFIEPHYVARMVEAIKANEISNGLNYRGNISFTTDPSSSDDPEESAWIFPYSLSLLKDSDEKILTDFTLEFGDNTFIVSFLMSQVLGNSNYSNGKSMSFSHMGDGNIQYHLTTNDDKVGDYKSVSLNDDIMPGIIKKLYSMAKSAESGTNTQLAEFIEDYKTRGEAALDWASWCPLFNSILAYDEDPAIGISVREDYLYTIQDFLDENRSRVIEEALTSITDESTKMIASQIIGNFLPETLQDIRTTFTLNSDGSFKGFDFNIMDNKTVSGKSVTYSYIGVDYNKADANYDANIFTKLSSTLSSAKKDSESIAKVNALKTAYEEKLMSSSKITGSSSSTLEKLYSVYNATHYVSDFSSTVKDYRNAALALTDSSSDTYVTNSALIINEYLTKPYAGFDVSLSSDSAANVLTDEWSAKAGDSFKISNLHAVGTDTDEAISSGDVKFALSSNAKNYITFDEDTMTLKVTSNPTKDVYATLTCSGTNYSSVTYRLHLSA